MPLSKINCEFRMINNLFNQIHRRFNYSLENNIIVSTKGQHISFVYVVYVVEAIFLKTKKH